jgi:hypothetical protein
MMTNRPLLAPSPSPSSTVRAARDAYLSENGFDTSGYTAATFEVEAFGRRYIFKNTDDRKWAIPLHDLHHVATGYGTDLIGEAEIGAFELVAGCKTPIVYALNLTAVLMGFAIAPVRTWRAFAHARQANARALYRSEKSTDGLLDLSVADLRGRLGIPNEGLSRAPRRLHDEQGARRQPWWLAILGLVYGLATIATVLFELTRGVSLEGVPLAGSARGVAIAVAAAGALLAGSSLAMRRGSLLGRALFGHAAAALIVLNVVSLLAFHMAPALAAFACSIPVVVLGTLSRSG